MWPIQDILAAFTSISLRILSYLFLRWIPGHPFPPAIATLAAIYFPSFALSFLTTPVLKVVADEVKVVTRPVANVNSLRTVASGKRPSAQNEPQLEEIDVSETVILAPRRAHVLSTLLLGLPSPASTLLSAATCLVNVVCVLMVLDLTYRSATFYPSHDLKFARVGYVSDHSANILVREPKATQVLLTLYYRQEDASQAHSFTDTTWKHGGSVTNLTDETDYTAAFEIKKLSADTRYEYELSNELTGYFVTAPKPGTVSSREGSTGQFTFLHTSCIKAHFPYNPLAHPLSVPGFIHLATWLGRIKPQFIMFLGDFIYIDVPRRFGATIEHYRREYRQIYASPDWPSVSKTDHAEPRDIPWIHVYDDHEIANDWDKNTTGVFPAAFDPYKHYHVSVNPPRVRSSKSNATWFSFVQGPASFFMLDTRRFRDASAATPPDDPTKTMLGAEQLADVLQWLQQPEPHPSVRWKILISSVPFTKNWRLNGHDTWAGYLAERTKILEAMWDLALAPMPQRVVILSGDRHEFAATAFPPPSGGPWPAEAAPHEFSASPLNMFYLPIRTYRQTDNEDVCLKYVPDGNSKFGAVEIEAPTGSNQSVLRYRLIVDGTEVWSHVLVAPPGLHGSA